MSTAQTHSGINVTLKDHIGDPKESIQEWHVTAIVEVHAPETDKF